MPDENYFPTIKNLFCFMVQSKLMGIDEEISCSNFKNAAHS